MAHGRTRRGAARPASCPQDVPALEERLHSKHKSARAGALFMAAMNTQRVAGKAGGPEVARPGAVRTSAAPGAVRRRRAVADGAASSCALRATSRAGAACTGTVRAELVIGEISS